MIAYVGLFGQVHVITKLSETGCQIFAKHRVSYQCVPEQSLIKMKIEYLQLGQCQPDIQLSKKFSFSSKHYCGKDVYINRINLVTDLNDSNSETILSVRTDR